MEVSLGAASDFRRLLLTADFLLLGRARDGLYEPALADSEREAVADLLQYLENVRLSKALMMMMMPDAAGHHSSVFVVFPS